MITNKKKDYLYKFFQKNLKLLWKITAKLIYIALHEYLIKPHSEIIYMPNKLAK